MSNKKSNEEVKRMFKHYLEKPSDAYVAAKCGVSNNTVRRYRLLDKWDERFEVIDKMAQDETDYNLAMARAEDIEQARQIKTKFSQAVTELMEKTENGKLFEFSVDKPKEIVATYEMIVKIRSLLMGGATERSDTVPPKVILEIVDAPPRGDRDEDEEDEQEVH